jgi:TolB protein
MHHLRSATTAAALLIALPALAQATQPAPWQQNESDTLTDQIQLTFPDQFEKAGEAYFSPDSKWIIFQAIATPEPGNEPEADYQMYVAPVHFENDTIVGLGDALQLSAPGSANTCGFFNPLDPSQIMFASTLVPPTNDDRPGYQRGESRYSWVFPTEMDIVHTTVPAIANSSDPITRPTPMWSTPGYDAECAYSPDARFIVFTHVDAESQNADIYIHDTQTNEHWPIVQAPGYDGGPFFSPDGTRLVYRSDRVGNDLLQVYVADLEFDSQGRPVAISREYPVTQNEHVNWGPFFHPSGEYLIYATSQISHQNYEVFAREIPQRGKPQHPRTLATKRITNAAGFDGLPVFSPDGKWLMWTSQRAGAEPGQERPSSQIWVARAANVDPR